MLPDPVQIFLDALREIHSPISHEVRQHTRTYIQVHIDDGETFEIVNFRDGPNWVLDTTGAYSPAVGAHLGLNSKLQASLVERSR